MKRFLAISLIVVCMAACTSKLTEVANGMQKASIAIGDVQSIIKDVYTSNLIDKSTEVELLQVCIKANLLGKEVDATIKAASSVDQATKNKLLTQIMAISTAVDPDKINAIANIKNPDTQQKVKAGFVAVRTSLTAVLVMLSS